MLQCCDKSGVIRLRPIIREGDVLELPRAIDFAPALGDGLAALEMGEQLAGDGFRREGKNCMDSYFYFLWIKQRFSCSHESGRV